MKSFPNYINKLLVFLFNIYAATTITVFAFSSKSLSSSTFNLKYHCQKPTTTCITSYHNTILTASSRGSTLLFSSAFDEDEDEDFKDVPQVVPSTPRDTATAVSTEDTTSNVPIDLPSPVLLSSSMVLAIASTGSIFEITGGKGSLVSLAIAIIGVPASLFLIYAAIQKGIAETEADDAEFQRKNNKF